MKKLRLALSIIGLLASFSALPAHAVGVWEACSTNGNSSSSVCADATNGDSNAVGLIKIIINTMLFVLGAIAVILIIHSGIKYTTSRGDPANIKSAKDTLLYAIIGLVVAILAYPIASFVVSRFE